MLRLPCLAEEWKIQYTEKEKIIESGPLLYRHVDLACLAPERSLSSRVVMPYNMGIEGVKLRLVAMLSQTKNWKVEGKTEGKTHAVVAGILAILFKVVTDRIQDNGENSAVLCRLSIGGHRLACLVFCRIWFNLGLKRKGTVGEGVHR